MHDAPGLRPSPDRVRETLFNWLAHFVPEFAAVRGLDLFAGTGALGFELASRGAAAVTLVERNRAVAAHLERVRRKLNAEQVRVLAADGLTAARGFAAASFDVVFLDPPFDSELLGPALDEAARLLCDNGLVYVESGSALEETAVSGRGLRIARAGRAGKVNFHLLQKA